MDTWAAVHAQAENQHLVTHNTRHFEHIVALVLEGWLSRNGWRAAGYSVCLCLVRRGGDWICKKKCPLRFIGKRFKLLCLIDLSYCMELVWFLRWGIYSGPLLTIDIGS